MKHDEDKIDEYTLALLYLVTHERHEGFGEKALGSNLQFSIDNYFKLNRIQVWRDN